MPRRTFWRAAVIALLCLLPSGLLPAVGADVVVTESQVKALCLLNFAKYVSWPAEAFPDASSPVRIAVLGDSKVHDDLKRAAHGKSIGSRPIVILSVGKIEEVKGCHVLFVGSSEKAHFSEILQEIKTTPVLTVGDTREFPTAGGTILLVKRDNKVRFEVNLTAARAARLQISSKLLALADAVHGKEESE